MANANNPYQMFKTDEKAELEVGVLLEVLELLELLDPPPPPPQAKTVSASRDIQTRLKKCWVFIVEDC